jgi:hypothetical protein
MIRNKCIDQKRDLKERFKNAFYECHERALAMIRISLLSQSPFAQSPGTLSGKVDYFDYSYFTFIAKTETQVISVVSSQYGVRLNLRDQVGRMKFVKTSLSFPVPAPNFPPHTTGEVTRDWE